MNIKGKKKKNQVVTVNIFEKSRGDQRKSYSINMA